MRYFRTAAFTRAYHGFDPPQQRRVNKALEQLAILFARSQRPFGIGLKMLKPGIWEIRVTRAERILFRWTGDVVELLIVGNHEDIRRLLKRL